MAYETDPKLQVPARYDRQECIDVMNDLYQFLTRLPYVQPDQIMYPPGGRWPNITNETLAPMGKNQEVVELLARLPYISIAMRKDEPNSNYPENHWCPIASDTGLIDFHGEPCRRLLARGAGFNALPTILPHYLETPSHVVSLTAGHVNG